MINHNNTWTLTIIMDDESLVQIDNISYMEILGIDGTLYVESGRSKPEWDDHNYKTYKNVESFTAYFNNDGLLF